eukprot:scaffold4605_cov105-Isochrysis_galbana.AAC.2
MPGARLPTHAGSTSMAPPCHSVVKRLGVVAACEPLGVALRVRKPRAAISITACGPAINLLSHTPSVGATAPLALLAGVTKAQRGPLERGERRVTASALTGSRDADAEPSSTKDSATPTCSAPSISAGCAATPRRSRRAVWIAAATLPSPRHASNTLR